MPPIIGPHDCSQRSVRLRQKSWKTSFTISAFLIIVFVALLGGLSLSAWFAHGRPNIPPSDLREADAPGAEIHSNPPQARIWQPNKYSAGEVGIEGSDAITAWLAK